MIEGLIPTVEVRSRGCEAELLGLLSLAPHEEPNVVFGVFITIGLVLIVTGRVARRCFA